MSDALERGTIKALAWQLLEGTYRRRLGEEEWQRLETAIPLLQSQPLDADSDLLLDPFNRALQFIDERLGSGDGTYVAEAARLTVERWGGMFQNLVAQLKGRPDKLLEIFGREVHPYFLNDPKAAQLVASTPTEVVLRLDNALLEPFKRGLLEGFVELAGATATVQRRTDGTYRVTWRLHEKLPRPSLGALFISAVRLPFLTATLVPSLVGLAIAANDGFFHWGLAGLTLLGVTLFHLGTNMMNDYWDHVSGADEANATLTPFSGGSRLVQRGLLPAPHLKWLAYAFYILGTGVGLLLTALRGIEVLWLGVAGFLLGFLYTAPPVRLAHRGLGELAVAVGFGPVIVLGTYFVQRQAWSLEALLASLPVAFLIAAVLYINEFPDKQGDARVGKRTLIVRLPERAAVLGYFALLALTYLVILGGVALRSVPAFSAYAFPVWSLLGLLTIPLAIKASLLLSHNYRFPYRLIPANAFTILLHLTTGLLFCAGYLIQLVA